MQPRSSSAAIFCPYLVMYFPQGSRLKFFYHGLTHATGPVWMVMSRGGSYVNNNNNNPAYGGFKIDH